MRAYKLKRETMEGTFSLLNAQLTVGELSKKDGTRLKGFTIGQMTVFTDYPFALSEDQVKEFIACLKKVERKELPAEFKMRFGFKNLATLTFSFSKYDPKWYGHGGIKGSVSWNMLLSIKWEPIEMSLTAISDLTACLERFYGIQAESAVVSAGA